LQLASAAGVFKNVAPWPTWP